MKQTDLRGFIFVGSSILFSASLIYIGITEGNGVMLFDYLALIIMIISFVMVVKSGIDIFRESYPKLGDKLLKNERKPEEKDQ